MRKLLLTASVLVWVPIAYAAIDSEAKRASAARFLPRPDAEIDAGDRAQLAGVYRGEFEGGGGGESSTGATTGNALGQFMLRRKR